MKEAADGKPEAGPTARMLGVRPGFDIPVDKNVDVKPLTGGLSVAPHDPLNLPSHRRPPALRGTGKDPVWRINTTNFGPKLKYVQDSAAHGTIQPVVKMSLAEYQQALAATASAWEKV